MRKTTLSIRFTPLPRGYEFLPPIFRLRDQFPFSKRELFPSSDRSRNAPRRTRRCRVGGRAGDDQCWCAGIQAPDALDNCNPFNSVPAGADLVRNLLHLCFGHRFVGLVFEIFSLVCIAAFRSAAHHASEYRRGSDRGQCDLIEQRVQVKFIFSDRVNGWRVLHIILQFAPCVVTLGNVATTTRAPRVSKPRLCVARPRANRRNVIHP
jgi:hypothetical protein